MMLSSSGRELISEQHDVALCDFAEKNLYTVVVSDSIRDASHARGTRGSIVDGLGPDVEKIEELPFPVVATEIKPVDPLGRGCITADFDGVVVVPNAIVRDVTELSPEKVRRENSSRAELMQGAYLGDVFQNYGVL